MTSPAIQLTSNRLLANIDYQGNIVDLSWPNKAEDNICLREAISFSIYRGVKLVSTKKVIVSNITDEQINYSYYFTDQENVASGTLGYLVSDKDALATRLTIRNTSDKDLVFSIVVHIPIDFGANMSRDCAFLHPVYGGQVFYEADKYLGVRASIAPVQFACHNPKDNMGRGARPDKHLNLSGNPVTTGRVEGALRYDIKVAAGDESELVVYFEFARNLEELLVKEKTEFFVQQEKRFLGANVAHLLHQKLGLSSTEIEKLQLLEVSSRNLVLGSIVETGGTFAAADSSYYKQHGTDDYAYFWPRDGAFTIQVLARILTPGSQKDKILEDYFSYLLKCFGGKPYLEHRYRLDSKANLASSWYPWDKFADNPIGRLQLDQTALSLVSYARIILESGYRHAEFEKIVPAVCDFLSSCIEADGSHKACYDLWENHYGKFTSTQATMIAGLKAGRQILSRTDKYVTLADNSELDNVIADSSTFYSKNETLIAQLDATITKALSSLQALFVSEGRFIKAQIFQQEGDLGFSQDNSHDSSVNLIWILGVLTAENPLVKSSVEAAALALSSKTMPGSYARYQQDHYLNSSPTHTGNPWYISSFWFASYFAKTGELGKTRETLIWALTHMEPAGILPEMADPDTGFALSVRPLIWSHVELLNLLNYLRE